MNNKCVILFGDLGVVSDLATVIASFLPEKEGSEFIRLQKNNNYLTDIFKQRYILSDPPSSRKEVPTLVEPLHR